MHVGFTWEQVLVAAAVLLASVVSYLMLEIPYSRRRSSSAVARQAPRVPGIQLNGGTLGIATKGARYLHTCRMKVISLLESIFAYNAAYLDDSHEYLGCLVVAWGRFHSLPSRSVNHFPLRPLSNAHLLLGSR